MTVNYAQLHATKPNPNPYMSSLNIIQHLNVELV